MDLGISSASLAGSSQVLLEAVSISNLATFAEGVVGPSYADCFMLEWTSLSTILWSCCT